MPNITTRPAVASDWEFLSLIQETCMKEYAVRTWGIWVPEPQENFRPEIHEIIQDGKDEIGCIAVAIDEDNLSLEKLYILPAFQRRGIATWLLRRLIERAHACGKSIRLRVLRVNPARRLYERNGFQIDSSSEERHFMSYTIDNHVGPIFGTNSRTDD
ncbi:GNAT family N-acetyltransferase [Paraburkholderia sp. J94]|uniref:GNAT family N-acetyltransferase n=1 Tax=Paraburkholderia sp. J94 TaxID=2805441 RepID=UPI002AAFD8F9|nr:GNAT family N-acetyltransferase [Paraburkholderia sp. J94]